MDFKLKKGKYPRFEEKLERWKCLFCMMLANFTDIPKSRYSSVKRSRPHNILIINT